MKKLISFLLVLVLTGLFISGCDSSINQGPESDATLSKVDLKKQRLNPPSITKEMCKLRPGWKALGYKNLGQCIQYAETGIGRSPTVRDIDGNIYPIVKIGNQWWMAENLRTTHYANGDPIATNLNNDDWFTTDMGAYAIYSHTRDGVEGIETDEEMLAAYGALYNWHAVKDPRRICPKGWHVPTLEEWQILLDYLEVDRIGTELKSTRIAPDPHPRWNSSCGSSHATNEAGFSAFPAGYRYQAGPFEDFGRIAFWWTSTKAESGVAWDIFINCSDQCTYSDTPRNNGFSVRCVMD